MNGYDYSSYIATAFTFLTASEITEHTVQIIYYVLGAISIIFSIVITFVKWYKNAKSDGKITIDELEDLQEIIKDLQNDCKDDSKK